MANILNRLTVKPQLARRHQLIPVAHAHKIVVKPSQKIDARLTVRPTARPVTQTTIKSAAQAINQVVNVRKNVTINQHHAPPVAKATPLSQPISPETVVARPVGRYGVQAVVQRPRTLRKQSGRKNSGVRYITADVTNYEKEKIRNLRGRGAGKILIIVGNGPSISEAPLELLRNHPHIDTMSINRPDERIWPTTYWAFFDQSQLRRHKHLWDQYTGITFNSTSIKEKTDYSIKIKNLGGFGFSYDLMRGLHIGRSSVYAAMQLGLWLDYRHIYVFGCDMSEVGGKTHFYGINPDAPPETRLGRFAKEAEYYDDAASKLTPEERQRFIFCSSYNPYSFVDKFSKLSQSDAVPRILETARTLFT